MFKELFTETFINSNFSSRFEVALVDELRKQKLYHKVKFQKNGKFDTDVIVGNKTIKLTGNDSVNSIVKKIKNEL